MKTKILKIYTSIGINIIIIFGAYFINSCAPSVNLTLLRPADINLSKYKKVAIGDIKTPSPILPPRNQYGIILPYANFESAGNELVDLITSRLTESNKFEVLDRQNVDKILQEQKLTAQGLTNDNNSIQLGEIKSASLLITGNINSANYKEFDIVSEQRTEKETKKQYTIKTRKGNLSYRVNIKFIDLETSKIVASKDIDASKNHATYSDSRSGKNTPDEINYDALYQESKNFAISVFSRMVLPYNIQKTVQFQKDGEMKDLKIYIEMLKNNNISDAIKGLEELSNRDYSKAKIKAKALYNYGIILVYTGEPEKAISILKEANKLEPQYQYSSAISEANNEIKIKQLAKEQGL